MSPPVFAHFIYKNRIVSCSRSNLSFSGALTENNRRVSQVLLVNTQFGRLLLDSCSLPIRESHGVSEGTPAVFVWLQLI